MRAPLIAVLSGSVWTVIAAWIMSPPAAFGLLGEIRWLACLAGPVIGLAAYYGSRWSYQKGMTVRIIWAVVSLYLAAGIYGLVLGLFEWPLLDADVRPVRILQPVVVCWYGLTYAFILWPLFGLSFLNHQILRRYQARAVS